MIAIVIALLAQANTPSPAPVAGKADAQPVWDSKCAACHGADGRGHTKKGRKLKAPDFSSAKFQDSTSEDEMEDAISNGANKGRMPAFKGKLTDAEINALVGFVRSLRR